MYAFYNEMWYTVYLWTNKQLMFNSETANK